MALNLHQTLKNSVQVKNDLIDEVIKYKNLTDKKIEDLESQILDQKNYIEELHCELETVVKQDQLKEICDDITTSLEEFVFTQTPRLGLNDLSERLNKIDKLLADLQLQRESELKNVPQEVPKIIFKKPVKKSMKV